jgi:hypothetical protein
MYDKWFLRVNAMGVGSGLNLAGITRMGLTELYTFRLWMGASQFCGSEL